MKLCACMGPMYGEPYCVCKMKELGLPLNEEARQADHERFMELIADLQDKILQEKIKNDDN